MVNDAISTHAAAASGTRTWPGLGRYLGGMLPRSQRILVALVGAALLPVMFLPVLPLWRIFLVAPQYREGLKMLIFTNDLRGDLSRINILNHYIGMQEIKPEAFPEFGYMPWVLSLFGLVALVAALSGRRWLAFLGWGGFAAFGTVMMTHFAGWLTEFGTNLDPKAALDFGAFTPPLIGTAVRGNFTVHSLPHIGGFILFAAGSLGPLIVAFDLWRFRRRGPGPAALRPGVAAAGILLLLTGPAGADEFHSYAEPPAVNPLQSLVNEASPGETVRIPDGVHRGQLVVDRTLTLEGGSGAILDGEGRGTVVVVRAPGCTLRGFTVRNSGFELLFDDAGILVDEADDVRIQDMTLVDTNHGIYVRNALRPAIIECRARGRRGRVDEENHGNGIHVWHTRDAVLEGSRISGHRDGIYLSFAETATIRGNVVHDLDRFGLHSMYSQLNVIEQNTFTRNTAGVALMFSNRMTMRENLFIHNRGHRTYGLLLRDCSDSEFRGNRIIDNTIGLFIDGSNRNRFAGNVLAENGWGVIAYSSSDANVFTGNSFLGNDYQVSLDMPRTGNRFHLDGVGNYWSDARPYDLDGDGIGDVPHSPVSLFAFISKQHPDLTVFSGSPAVLALDLAQRSLPILQPTELLDPGPLLQPVSVAPYSGPAVPPLSDTAPGSTLATAFVALLATAGGATALRRVR
jgi:nitrous oxidase accessory protein